MNFIYYLNVNYSNLKPSEYYFIIMKIKSILYLEIFMWLRIKHLLIFSLLLFIWDKSFAQSAQIEGSFVFSSELEQRILKNIHNSQHKNKLLYLSAVNSSTEQDFLLEKQQEVQDFIHSMQERRKSFKQEHRFLERVFYQVHRKFLKRYVPYTSFYDLLEQGTYDCLTGSSLYAFVAEGLGFEYEIIETNYHVYLLIKGEQETYLFESTDPLEGFVKNHEEIERRKAIYRDGGEQSDRQIVSAQNYHQFSFTIETSVNTAQLVGLHYYNASVVLYNDRKLEAALQSLEKAVFCYPNARMAAMAKIILNSMVQDSSIPMGRKNAYFRKFRHVIEKNQLTLLTKG